MNLSIEEWGERGKVLGEQFRSAQWSIGQWWNQGEEKFGEQASQYMDAPGLNHHLLQRYAKVAKAFLVGTVAISFSRLSFSHHEESLSLPLDERCEWLIKADLNKWDTREFRRQIKSYLAKEK